MGVGAEPFPCAECPVPKQAAQVEGVGCAGMHRIEETEGTVLSLGAIGAIVGVEALGFRCPWVSGDAPGNFVPIALQEKLI